ncbi:hypothetical protein DY000_02033937 [Brassica cretica]|uniref:Uncharacterized protein n=1 Tax=Brassica cretica TaxID=69181 RepID=A0ABQ7DKS5_BRACR|nr:hypothetical protein DY000_02033937 [Brassica cretica]
MRCVWSNVGRKMVKSGLTCYVWSELARNPAAWSGMCRAPASFSPVRACALHLICMPACFINVMCRSGSTWERRVSPDIDADTAKLTFHILSCSKTRASSRVIGRLGVPR